ncbi:putative protein kinase RLK-Pelle-WAK family [Helianthus annuus]|uniref:Putative tyrosine-protein kinase, neurotrophic receptor, type 2 n=1 Tax=Helianthus annuus TaxID=4232 RepID=A0A251V666_HELAN|nr:putative protein kinase RLK-Pelle-WAK family [Helianthus annuus]KAJ0592623.1 putative protein kinase RLK-Pelle-WAK family [Helianthus annuus]KAJ0600231.1 putative protein kinase RLK-Pelle-WAK family [Helianthus annuus]KAJ0607618.1 putative protein kinase RLK-Pelle-WAK family [Helianthus annuus]KAJ0767683.1 putative protein kinase RLK-Pelle-WAK family [Helianthus annuus]
MKKLQISLENIQVMTEKFSDQKCIGKGRNWKQYEGELLHANGCITAIAKQFDSKSDKQQHFLKELEILCEYKHKNIIGVVGYCLDDDEKIIVYKHALNGRLSKHLGNTSFTWMKRLKIGIDVAYGLNFLHTGDESRKIPIRNTNINSTSILLDDNWIPKISNLELSKKSLKQKEIEHVTDKSDIYSLGVVLVEMLCGSLSWVEGNEDHSHSLAEQWIKEGKLGELVFEGIKEQINPKSLAIFKDIVVRCLKDDTCERPNAYEVAIQLKKARQFQVRFLTII